MGLSSPGKWGERDGSSEFSPEVARQVQYASILTEKLPENEVWEHPGGLSTIERNADCKKYKAFFCFQYLGFSNFRPVFYLNDSLNVIVTVFFENEKFIGRSTSSNGDSQLRAVILEHIEAILWQQEAF